jgi:hypothetical protein
MAALEVGAERRSTLLVAMILGAGAAMRIAWLLTRPGIGHADGEAENVAVNFARTGTIGDVFARGSGPTAHLNPLLSAFSGLLYKIFGIQSVPAEIVLATVSITLVLGSFFLLYRAFGLLGTPRIYRLSALALTCLLPVNIQLETITFRVWEGALVVFLSSLLLWYLLKCAVSGRKSTWDWLVISALACANFWISPAIGLADFALLAVYCLVERRPREWVGLALTTSLVLVIVFAPWTIRNYQEFDRFIPLRSNAGLELALANYPAAIASTDDGAEFKRHLQQIHPLETQAAYDRMVAAGGERDYADALGAEAMNWIRSNPTSFGRLMLRHCAQFYFPPRWFWTIYNDQSRGTAWKQAAMWLTSALGLIAAVLAVVRWRGLYLYVAVLILVPALPYAVVQPILRYRYLVFAISLFAAADLIGRVVVRLDQRSR